MALPAQQFRFSGMIPIQEADRNLPGVLEAIADWLNTATEYVTGPGETIARVPGEGSAWEAVIQEDTGTTVALRLVPPSGAEAQNQRVMLAGVTAGTPTPAMYDANTFETNRILSGICKNVANEEAYDAWDAADPYTGADFTGYSKSFDFDTLTPTHLCVIEGREAICVVLVTNGTGNPCVPILGGAVLDPFSEHAQDAETDGRLYGVGSSVTELPTNWLFNISNNTSGWLRGGIANNRSAFYCFNPGVGTTRDGLIPVGMNTTAAAVGANALISPSATVWGCAPIEYVDSTSGPYSGRLRDIRTAPDGRTGNIVKDPQGNVVGYLVGARVSADADCVLFLH